MKYTKTVKILHALIVFTVSLQLLSQFWMFVPSPDKLPETWWAAWLFVAHLSVGVMALCFVAVRLMSVLDDEGDAKRLFPWLNWESFVLLIAEIKTMPLWFKQGAPDPGQDSKVASMVHGMGLLLLLAMGGTGILFYLGLAPDGAMDGVTHFFRESHAVFAVLLWLYLIGHIGMFFKHLKDGHHGVLTIFLRKKG